MTDGADQAQELEALDRQLAIAGGRVPRRRGTDDCVACGRPIPATRKAAAAWATRCIDCQREFEGNF